MTIFDKLFANKNSKEANKNQGKEANENLQSQEDQGVSEKMKAYMDKFSPDDSPGWDAIDEELGKLYEVGSERHYPTSPMYIAGGDDPIDGFSIYDNETQTFHRHIISYGVTELYYNPNCADHIYSKWGSEFTMRLIPYEGDRTIDLEDGTKVDHEPLWAMDLMQNLARYVFNTGKWFEPYHVIPLSTGIKADTDTKLVAVSFVDDPQLATLETPNGRVHFLQIVGLTKKELDWIKEDFSTTRVKALIDKMRADNPLLLVDIMRDKEYVD